MAPPNINDLSLPAHLTDAERLCLAADVVVCGFIAGVTPSECLPFALRQVQLLGSVSLDWVASFLLTQSAYVMVELDRAARHTGATLQLAAEVRFTHMVNRPDLYLASISMRAGFSHHTEEHDDG